MDEATARARLERMVAADTAPTLTVDEVDDLIDLARRPDAAGNPSTNTVDAPAWAASTTYAPGTIIRIASTPPRYWKAANSGISDTTAPAWPALAGDTVTGASLSDGSVTWIDNGGEWSPTWDLDAAAADGWQTKAGKAAGSFDFAEDGQQFTRSQMHAHCIAMITLYSARQVGSVTVNASWPC